MSTRPIKVAVAAVAASAVAVSAFGVSAAYADPSAQAVRTYSAVGSDTIQDLYNSFTDGYTAAGTTFPGLTGVSINSYNAFGGNIQPVNATVGFDANAFGRPNGSGQGRQALSAAWNPATANFAQTTSGTAYNFQVTPKSVDIARSSGKPAPGNTVTAGATGDNLTSVPLARDAVSVATFGVSTITSFTYPQLEAIFGSKDTATGGAARGDEGLYFQGATPVWNNDLATATGLSVGDIVRISTASTATGADDPYYITAVDGTGKPTAQVQLHPVLPQSSSGTRTFFLGALNNSTNAKATWVADGFQENNGSVLSATQNIIPFSAAQWIAQKNGVAPATGLSNASIELKQINNSDPVTAGATLTPGPLYGALTAAPAGTIGQFARDVYSVVATQKINSDSALSTLVSTTLPNSANVNAFGFGKLTYSSNNTTWIHSKFENTGLGAFTTVTNLTANLSGSSIAASVKVTAGAAVTPATTKGVPTGAPAGSVQFLDGTTVLQTVALSDAGTASATLTGLSVGAAHTITAKFVPTTGTFAYSFATSESSATVGIPSPSIPAGTVAIAGTAKVGTALSARAGSFGDGVTLYYQWKANGANIAGATAASYVPAAAVVGKALTVSVTAVREGYVSSSATSAATAKVATGTLKTPSKVTISGTAKVGKTLTANHGSWTAGTSFSYQWYANGKAISKATKSTYKATTGVKGKKITVKVIGKLSGYTAAFKISAATKAVAK